VARAVLLAGVTKWTVAPWARAMPDVSSVELLSKTAVAGLVAPGAAEFGFLDEGPFGLLEGGDVVVLEEVAAAAVDAVLTVALLDDELLSLWCGGGVYRTR
jgi:ABC-type amino acid transport substrate-binding protein